MDPLNSASGGVQPPAQQQINPAVCIAFRRNKNRLLTLLHLPAISIFVWWIASAERMQHRVLLPTIFAIRNSARRCSLGCSKEGRFKGTSGKLSGTTTYRRQTYFREVRNMDRFPKWHWVWSWGTLLESLATKASVRRRLCGYPIHSWGRCCGSAVRVDFLKGEMQGVSKQSIYWPPWPILCSSFSMDPSGGAFGLSPSGPADQSPDLSASQVIIAIIRNENQSIQQTNRFHFPSTGQFSRYGRVTAFDEWPGRCVPAQPRQCDHKFWRQSSRRAAKVRNVVRRATKKKSRRLSATDESTSGFTATTDSAPGTTGVLPTRCAYWKSWSEKQVRGRVDVIPGHAAVTRKYPF